MKVQVARSKNACSYYVTKGFRNLETGRPTTKVVERLGNEEAIRARISGKLKPSHAHRALEAFDEFR